MAKEIKKRLKKSSDGILGGVCGGIAEYLDLDPTVVRLIAVGLAILSLSTVFFYLLAALVMPNY